MSKKEDLEAVKKIVEEESIAAFIDYNARYEFHHLCGDLKTIFVYESPDTSTPVEFEMLKDLERRLKELNSRYTVGILYQAKEMT